jgi:ATP/ADP translocase
MSFMLGLNLAVMIFTVVTLIKIKKLNKEYEEMCKKNKEEWDKCSEKYDKMISLLKADNNV